MCWVDSLSENDVHELSALRRRLGPLLFEPYLLLTLSVHVDGPISETDLAACLAERGEFAWRRISSEFELRGGAYHIRRRPAGSLRA